MLRSKYYFKLNYLITNLFNVKKYYKKVELNNIIPMGHFNFVRLFEKLDLSF